MGLRARCDEDRVIYIEDTGWLQGITAPGGQLSVADIQIISFLPGKSMSLGEGGSFLFRDKEIYDSSHALSQHPEPAGSLNEVRHGHELVNRPFGQKIFRRSEHPRHAARSNTKSSQKPHG